MRMEIIALIVLVSIFFFAPGRRGTGQWSLFKLHG